MSLDRIEIINMVESLARDKGISKDQLMLDLELAIEEVGKKKYGAALAIKAKLNKKTGEINLYRVLEVVENLDDRNTQILLRDAQERDNALNIGDEFYDLLPFVDLGRSEALTFRACIAAAVKRAEKEKEYDDFINKVGEMIIGVVKRIEFGNLVIDLGRNEALIKKDQLMPSDRFKVGDRVKAYLKEVKRQDLGAQIFLSRTSEQMLVKLFEIEVPEIADGLIAVKAVVRDAGSKAKIAVVAIDSATDAVACCIGMRGTRVRAIIDELGGEKVDVVNWSPDVTKYVINALAINKVTKVTMDQSTKKVCVVVPSDQLSAAIGRGGQNVKLASRLTQYNIDVLSEENESRKRLEEFHSVSQALIEELDLDETLGQFLVVKGFSSVEQIANTDVNELMAIEGFDQELASELSQRSKECYNKKQQELTSSINALGVENELIELLREIGLKNVLLLAQNGVKSFEDLATCSPAELLKMLPSGVLSSQDAKFIIAQAKDKAA
jgi:N utilization substance protein A